MKQKKVKAITEIPEAISIIVDDKKAIVNGDSFVKRSCRMLRDFGYTKLKLETVRDAILNLLNGKKAENVIEMMLEVYIDKEQPQGATE